MKFLMILTFVAIAFAAEELKLGRHNEVKGGMYYFELKEELDQAQNISHEKCGYKVVTVLRKTEAPAKKGRFYINIVGYNPNVHTIRVRAVAEQKTHEIALGEIFKFKAGNKNNAITYIKTSLRFYGFQSTRTFFVETNIKNAPSDAKIKGRKLENGKQKFYFEYNTLSTGNVVSVPFEGFETFECEIKIIFSHISPTDQFQHYLLNRHSEDSYEDIYINSKSSDSQLSSLVNFIAQDADIPFNFPTSQNYEYKSKQYVRNGVFWGSHVRIPKKPGQNFGISIKSEKEGTRYCLVYTLKCEYFEQTPVKFSYQLSGKVIEIGTFNNDFEKNVTISRGAVLYPTIRFMMNAEKPKFLRFSWKIIQWGQIKFAFLF
eukprot:gene464-6875_t